MLILQCILFIAPALTAMMFREEQDTDLFHFDSDGFETLSPNYFEELVNQKSLEVHVSHHQSLGRHRTERWTELITGASAVLYGFCWLQGGRGHRVVYVSEGQTNSCRLERRSSGWFLVSRAESSYFECYASCVTNLPGVVSISAETVVRGEMGLTFRDLQPAARRFCFLTRMRDFVSATEECTLSVTESDRWQLFARSGHRSFECGVQCMDMEQQVTYLPGVEVEGRGSWTRSMGSSPTLCFLSDVKGKFRRDERCRFHKSGNEFRLEAFSGSHTFRCGSICMRVDTPAGPLQSANHRWVHHATGAQPSLTIQSGTSRANSRSVTTTWGHDFTLTIANPGFSTFGGVALTYGLSYSQATSIQSSASVSVSFAVTDGCPHRQGHFAALFQYVIDGFDAVGMDTVFTLLTRCHYHTTPNVPAPECPFHFCGSLDVNPLCELSKCEPWTGSDSYMDTISRPP
jgi:hypothetical protein